MIRRPSLGLLLSCLFIWAVGAPVGAAAGPFDGEWRGRPRKTCNGQVSEIVVSVHGDKAKVNVVGKDNSRSAVEGAVSEYGSLFARGTVERKRGTRSFSIIRFNGHFIRGSFSGEIEIDNCKTAVTLDRTTPPDSTVGEGRLDKSKMQEPVSARTPRARSAYPYDGEWSGMITCQLALTKPHDILVTIKGGSFKTKMKVT